MLATCPSLVVSVLFSGLVSPAWPICATNVPLFVNLSSMRSPPPFPASQTKPCLSTQRPCSVAGQSGTEPGPPQAWSILPCLSNSITDGAGKQHCDRGGVCAAPASSAVSVRGRWRIQIWSWLSTARPPTWPMSQLWGSCLGQDGSTLYCGGFASLESACAAGAEASATTAPSPRAKADALVHVFHVCMSHSLETYFFDWPRQTNCQR